MNALLVWGRSFIDQRLSRQYVRSICLIILAIFFLALSVSFATQSRGRTIFGPFFGADFATFYVTGLIIDQNGPEKVYDRALQNQFYRDLFPDWPRDIELAFANTPFFVVPLPLLSRLSYSSAYLLWLLISLGLYVVALKIVWRTLHAMPQDAWLTALLLALSFMPFLAECLAGGQTSAFAVFLIALAISFDKRGRWFLSGLALSLCSYKPTLLLLILPMLVITRRLSILRGFVTGCLGLTIVSLLAVGWEGCLGYIDALLFITDASISNISGLRTWKYVDVNSFFRLLSDGHYYIKWMMILLTAVVVAPLLFRSWLKVGHEKRGDKDLVWALTITWTLVLNVHVGIYDTALIVLSVLLTANILYQRANEGRPALPPAFKYLLLLLYIVPWFTQPLARLTSVQLYTVVLLVFGVYQLRMILVDGEIDLSRPFSTRMRSALTP